MVKYLKLEILLYVYGIFNSNTAVQSQNTGTAFFPSKHLPHFDYAEQYSYLYVGWNREV